MHPTLDPANLQTVRDLLPEPERSPFIDEMIGTFLADMEGQLHALRAVVGAGDMRACRAIAHRMRGGSGGIGAMHMVHLCAELEGMAQKGALPLVSTYVSRIEAEYGQVVQALERERRLEAHALV